MGRNDNVVSFYFSPVENDDEMCVATQPKIFCVELSNEAILFVRVKSAQKGVAIILNNFSTPEALWIDYFRSITSL